MIQTGLTSVTFRKLTPREVVQLASQAGLQGIEWGGDVHLPPGDVVLARELAAMTRDAGLEVAAYGSYYRAGVSPDSGLSFEGVLEAAAVLGAGTIRIWAGAQGSSETSASQYIRVVDDARRCSLLAEKEGISISFEFHGGTLTDSSDAALNLVQDIGHANVRLYWQPDPLLSQPARVQSLEAVLPYLSHVHAFHWTIDPEGVVRHPLSEGAGQWLEFVPLLDSLAGEHFVSIEFVKADSPSSFLADAAALRSWLNTNCENP